MMSGVRKTNLPSTSGAGHPYLLEGVLVSLLVLGPAVAIAVAMDAGAGSVADWVGALSTLAAFIAAVAATRYAARAFFIEQQRDLDRLAAETRAQASLVAAWSDYEVERQVGLEPAMGGSAHEPFVGVPVLDLFERVARNASRLPVSNFWIQIYLIERDEYERDQYLYVASTFQGRLLPEDDKPFRCSAHDPVVTSINRAFEAQGVLGNAVPRLVIGWSFRDNASVDWVRGPDGALEPGPYPGPPSESQPYSRWTVDR